MLIVILHLLISLTSVLAMMHSINRITTAEKHADNGTLLFAIWFALLAGINIMWAISILL